MDSAAQSQPVSPSNGRTTASPSDQLGTFLLRYEPSVSAKPPSVEMALGRLRSAGLDIRPAGGTIPGLYVAPGYPELTTNQVFSLAGQLSR